MNLLVLDLETTGLDSEANGILSIAAKLYNSNREVVTSFKSNCNPEDAEINLGALKVNRFTIETIKSLRSEKDTILHFCDWLLSLKVDGELVVAGHNVHFDLSFIKSKLKKYNISGFDQAVSHRVIDTASVGRVLVEAGVLPKNTKISLKDLVVASGIEYDSERHHSAEYDVNITAKLLFKMIDLLKE